MPSSRTRTSVRTGAAHARLRVVPPLLVDCGHLPYHLAELNVALPLEPIEFAAGGELMT